MSADREPWRHCAFVRRDGELCGARSSIVVEYGSGVGACKEHIRPQLLWCMEQDERGGEPTRVVTVLPTWVYAERE